MNKVHARITCDVCHQHNIAGIRYACLVCDEYDLCEKCYVARRASQEHKPYHPMQAILLEDEFFESLGGVSPEDVRIFCCPYCGDRELSGGDLIQHCRRYHCEGGHPIRCPICLVFRMRTRHMLNTTLLDHSLRRHKEYCSTGPAGESSRSKVIKECPICIEKITVANNTKQLHCGHQFHTDCIMRWFQNNANCPICRAEVDRCTVA